MRITVKKLPNLMKKKTFGCQLGILEKSFLDKGEDKVKEKY